jgi:hypothetical protein
MKTFAGNNFGISYHKSFFDVQRLLKKIQLCLRALSFLQPKCKAVLLDENLMAIFASG